MSSAEAFALMLAQGPRVTTMGDRTAGSSGNPRRIEAGNSVTVNLPRWNPLDPTGKPFDAVGVQPDVLVRAEGDVFAGGQDPVLEAAIQHLRKLDEPSGALLQSREGF